MKACADCGRLTRNYRCPDHEAEHNRSTNRRRDASRKRRGVPQGGARIPQAVRLAVLQRDDHTCAYCGGKADTVDHIIPLTKGGQATPDNLVAACGPCNYEKGDR